MLLDYESLRVIWWLLLGALLMGIAIMDGFDYGVGMLLHRVAKTDDERRVVLNTIGPVWEGNQVWLILGGGAIFAAWPILYAAAFSGFYFAMLAVLFGLILRPVGFKYRSKLNNPLWRGLWDIGLLLGGLLPALVFGVAVGNVLQGVPFHFDSSLRFFYTGSFWALFNPFALLCGVLSVIMLVMHGGIFLAIKTTGMVQQRASRYVSGSAILVVILFAAAGYWVCHDLVGYHLLGSISHDGPSNPLMKHVVKQTGAWLNNYQSQPLTMIAPALGFAGTALAFISNQLKAYKTAWVCSAVAIAGVIATVGFSMFPFILPSASQPEMSLLVWDASSSHLTLWIMLIATVIFLPLIIFYTSWIYYVLRGKVTAEEIQHNSHHMY